MDTYQKMNKNDYSIITSHEESETLRVGERIGELLTGGEIIALNGQLGAGKTCLVKGIARGLDITDVITSSSFVLASSYNGRLKLHHLDFYRLYESEDFFTIGFDDFVSPDAVVIIEWGERFARYLPQPYLNITFSVRKDFVRNIAFAVKGNDEHLESIIREVKNK